MWVRECKVVLFTELDQSSDLFKIPFTTDVSIIKLDNQGNYTQVRMLETESHLLICLIDVCFLVLQVLSPPSLSQNFFKSTGITSFGTEAIFLPVRELDDSSKSTNLKLPVNTANLSEDVFDLDQLRSRGRRVLIGSCTVESSAQNR